MLKTDWSIGWCKAVGICVVALAGWLACCSVVSAQTAPLIEYRLGSQDLGDALNEFALQSGSEILFSEEEVAGARSREVVGPHEPQQALNRLLAGSGLRFRIDELGTFLVGNRLSNEGSLASNAKASSLAAGVATAAAIATGTVSAEEPGSGEGQATVIEEIVVYGIRSSLQKSLDRKRGADFFVDTITAEDIGAFPDQNLAEALQRVSGVAIDRKEGEGAFVSVRGLGPQFVQTTTNHREVPSNVNPGATGEVGNATANAGSRAVGLNQFQAELVQAVEVYKSPRADHIEGGLGGVVEIETRRPLDLGERRLAFGASATLIKLSDDTAPSIFGLYSDTFADDTFGFLLSVSWDERTNRSDAVRTNGGFTTTPQALTVDGEDISAFYVNGFNGVLRETERERLNVSSAIQWRPTDRLDITVDALIADNQVDTEDYWYASYRTSGGLRNNLTSADVVNDNGELVLETYSTRNANSFTQVADEAFDTEMRSIGANLKFQATDRLSVDLDVSFAKTDSTNDYREYLIRNTRLQAGVSVAGGKPSITSTADWGNPDDYEFVKAGIQAHEITDEITQFRGDVTYEFDDDFFDTIQFGGRYSNRVRDDQQRFLVTRAFTGDPIALFGGEVAFPESDFLDGVDHDLSLSTTPGALVLGDLDAAHRVFTDRAAEVLEGPGFCPSGCSLSAFKNDSFPEDLDQQEDTLAVYGMVTFSGEMRSLPFGGNVGVRYVDTKVDTSGFTLEILGFDLSDPLSPLPILSEPALVDFSHDYTEALPSINLYFNLADDLLLRVAAGKVMSRPSFFDLNPRTSFSPNLRQFRGGNAFLDPTTAWQYDLALEWYFAEYSILSVGVFHKSAKGFVQQELGTKTIPGQIDPITGEPAEFLEFVPQNADDAKLTGVEISYQQTFAQLPAPFDGLGVIANYTYIDSKSDFENDTTGATFGIPGLSENTINVSMFYEKGPWAARVAYNFRDEFLDQVNGFSGGHPLFVDAYSQLDASISYRFTDNITVGLEAINLTDETDKTFVLLGTGSRKWFDSEVHTGPRYQANFSVKL